MTRAAEPSPDIKPLAEAASGEVASRRVRRVERTFATTTSELKIVVRHLEHARQVIADSVADEMHKPEAKRLPDDMIRGLRDQASMLERVIREMKRGQKSLNGERGTKATLLTLRGTRA